VLPAGTNNIGDVDIVTMPAVTQGGTWTVQPGNTANTTAWKVDGSAVTQPVNGTVTANIGTGVTKGPGAANSTSLNVTIDTAQVGSLVAGGVPVVSGGYQWETIPAGTTNQIVGTTGSTTDYLDNILVIVTDAANSHVWLSSGGTPVAADMVFPDNVGAGIGSYPVPIGNVGGPWRISTGSGAIARCSGKIT
jgi:hypothetical protein